VLCTGGAGQPVREGLGQKMTKQQMPNLRINGGGQVVLDNGPVGLS